MTQRKKNQLWLKKKSKEIIEAVPDLIIKKWIGVGHIVQYIACKEFQCLINSSI